MVRLNTADISRETCEKLIHETLSDKQAQIFRENMNLDWSYNLPGVGRFRANGYYQMRGISAAYRLIPEQIRTLRDLSLPESVYSMADNTKGLVLVTGPTGSGKSTTLAALINHINLTRKEHIITIEDPIEFVHKNVNCLINQREVVTHTKSFSDALRAALREDPDVILIGELRDLETMSLALTAAQTGHLVFATLHTGSASKAVDRIIDSFPSDQQNQVRTMLAESLCGVVAQALLPRSDKPGQIAALEVLVANSAIRNLIRENKTFQIQSVMQTSAQRGMISFEKSAKNLLEKGIISQATATGLLGQQA
jgi:twitching motility protein PilT